MDIIAFYYNGLNDQVLFLKETRIESHCQNEEIDYLFELEWPNRFLFGKFITFKEREILLCITSNYEMFIFDSLKLKHKSATAVTPIYYGHLFASAHWFKPVSMR